MKSSTKTILLACTALTAAHFSLPAVAANDAAAPMIIAQAPPDAKKEEPKPAPPPAAEKPPAPPAPPAAKPPAPPAPPPAAAPAPPPPPAAQRPAAPPPPAAERPAPPAPPTAKPAAPPAPPAAQAPAAPKAAPPAPPAGAERRGPPDGERRGGRDGERRDGERRDGPDRDRRGGPDGERRGPGAPPASASPTPPKDDSKPAAQPAPPAAAPATPPANRAAPGAPPAPPPGAAQQAPAPNQPPAAAARAPQGNLPASAPPPPPTQARSASDFIRRGDQRGPERGFDDIRRERRETRDGNRTIISEGDRTIIRDGDRTIIRHNEADRFAVDARDVRVTRRGNDTISIIVRPDGTQIITTTGPDGRLIRRARRDRGGREVVIIDNRFAGARPGFFVNVPPPRYRGPPERYILDGRRINREAVATIFLAPPIQRVDRRYTLEEVRYSEPLRAYMPRVDLDVNFATGSWQLSQDQFDQLAVIADGIKQSIAKNPREVFLIEGHTDAVGSDEDNLSLSDRRAQSVAVALTEEFQVPPENLVTQGYGEQDLKVDTDGPSEENRRVAVRRITPLIDQQAAR